MYMTDFKIYSKLSNWLRFEAEDESEKRLVVDLDPTVLIRVVLSERLRQRLQQDKYRWDQTMRKI